MHHAPWKGHRLVWPSSGAGPERRPLTTGLTRVRAPTGGSARKVARPDGSSTGPEVAVVDPT